MKRLLFIFSCFYLTAINLDAQFFKGGVKAGLSTFDIEDQGLTIFNQEGREEFTLFLQEGSYGYHFGLWSQFQLGSFFLRPELLFNSNSVDFRFAEGDNQVGSDIFSERYNHLDIPVLFGFTLGPLRLNGGPVGHVFISSASDLFQFSEYSEQFRDMTVGWQAGVGLDIWRLGFDVRYEGNFNNFGDHIRFFGEEYAFSDRSARLLGSVSYKF